jgi:uncharacterized protein YkwD
MPRTGPNRALSVLGALCCAATWMACGDVVGTPIRGIRAAGGGAEDGGAINGRLASKAPPDSASLAAGPSLVATTVSDPAYAPATSTAAARYCAATAQWPADQANAEQALVNVINAARTAASFSCGGATYHYLAPLRVMPQMRCSARLHSLDMANHDYFGMSDASGETPPTRMLAAGLTFSRWGELISRAGTDPAQVLNDLLQNTPSGCTLLSAYLLTGIGVGFEGGLWTVDLAGP